ncbi:hypothetical protein [Zhaonella formicivorans]|uniref:hypothetical protein n=1 Tax=Zhaonella formicivorans TaxID=2528593 RepID=UPI0010F1ED79|nr:hypothetical protein [Zhaonella formicivorans]
MNWQKSKLFVFSVAALGVIMALGITLNVALAGSNRLADLTAGVYSIPHGTWAPGSMMGGGSRGFGMLGREFGSGLRSFGMMSGSWMNWNAGFNNPIFPLGKEISLEKAKELFVDYIRSYKDDNLEIAEIMEFSNQYYAAVKDNSTGIYAMELIVNKNSGAVYPEMGPNMMWNETYGHMGRRGMMAWYGNRTELSKAVDEDQAVKLAQEYLDQVQKGTIATDPAEFDGYYTLHIEKDGKITGMLSVNSYTGNVWYHSWHGDFIKIEHAE